MSEFRKQNPATHESVARRGECRELSTAQVRALVDAALRERGIVPYEIMVSVDPVVEGALFDISGARPAWPEGSEYAWCYVAFVDPMEAHDLKTGSHTKWAHPAWLVFVPAMGEGETRVAPHDFPPHHTAPTSRPLRWDRSTVED